MSEVPVQTVVDVPGQQSCVPELFVALRAAECLGWLAGLWLRLRSVKWGEITGLGLGQRGLTWG